MQLEWKNNDNPTPLNPGILRAQGHRRVYFITSTLVGNNRFRMGIQRGANHFLSVLPADLLSDAKAILQYDHDTICELIAAAKEEGL